MLLGNKMKINEVILNEAPVNPITQKIQGLGSRVLNKIGMKSRASNLAGKADLGATANNLYKQFNSYLGTQNKNVNQATGKDLSDFLSTKNVKKMKIPAGPIDKNTINQILMDISKKAMQRQQGVKQTPSKTVSKPAAAPTTKLKIPADVFTSVSKLPTEQKIALAQAIIQKYGTI